MPFNIGKRLIQPADTIGMSYEKGVQCDAHDPRLFGSFPIQGIKLIFNHLTELLRGHVMIKEGRDVIQIKGIRHGDEAALLDVHGKRLIIAAPITKVFYSRLSQNIRCVKGLLKCRAEPALGSLSCGLFNDLQGGPNNLSLLGFIHAAQQHGVTGAMAEKLPTAFLPLFNNDRIVFADVGVEKHRCFHIMIIQQFHQPPYADPVAVIPCGKVKDIGRGHVK